MRKSKIAKALMVLGIGMVTATSLAVSACSDEHNHVDEDKNGKCDICGTDMTPEGGGETLKVDVEKVELNESSITLDIGDEKTLTAIVTPDTATDKTVTWTVAPEGVVTVDNGKVKAVAEGNATVTATADGKSATCSVKVNAPAPKPEVTEEEWAEILESPTCFTVDLSTGEVHDVTVKIDGDKISQETDDVSIICVKDGEDYYQYSYVDGEWIKEDLAEEDYLNGQGYARLVSYFKDLYEEFTYADGVYTAESVEISLLHDTAETVEITFDNGNLLGIKILTQLGYSYEITEVGTTSIQIPTIDPDEGDDGDDDKEEGGEGGGNENLPNITEWSALGDAIYGEINEGGTDYIYHHLWFNDSAEQAYDFDGFEVTATLDGVEGEVVLTNFDSNAAASHNYHLHIRVKGNRYQTTVFNINFLKDEEVVATGTYTRVGDKEIVLDSVSETISKGESAIINITSVNGKTDLTGFAIAWTIADVEGEGVATIPANSDGALVEVSAVAEGKATLTCTVGEGDDAFSKTCAITVVEGEVVIVAVDVSSQVHFNNKFQTSKEAVQIYFDLQGANYADLVEQIDPSKTTVEVTMDGNDSTGNIIRKEWQATGTYNLWLQIEVQSNWDHDYVFRFSFKNAKGDEVAYGTYQEIAPKAINLSPATLNLTLVDGEEVTGVVAATKTGAVDGDIEWSIDDESVATITDNGDGTVTVTAVAKGTAILTASADGIEKTCTVNVLEAGEEPTEPTVTNARIIEVYGGDVHCGVILDGSDELASMYPEVASQFAYVKVNGVKNNDMKDMFAYGADGSYRVNVYMGGTVQQGTDYVFEICDADGNVLLKTVAIQWN